MKIQVYPSYDLSKWDDLICSLGGNVFHSSAWSIYKKASLGAMPLYLLGQDGGNECVAASLVFLHTSRRWPLSLWSRFLEIDTTPLVRDNNEGILKEFLAGVEYIARQRRCLFIKVHSSAAWEFNPRILQSLGYDLAKRYEFRLDLDLPMEALWKNMKENRRREVKKALKNNLKFVENNTISGLENLRELQLCSRQRARERGEDYPIPELDRYQKLKDYLVDRGMGRVFLAQKDAKVISAALILHFDDRAFYRNAGHDSLGYSLGAPSFLIWNVIGFLQKRGVKEFNLGGVPGDANSPDSFSYGLYHWKRQWGGRITEPYGGQKTLSPIKYELITNIKTAFLKINSD
jgi:hypothetical protein